MQSEQIGNELIIRETPGCLWFFGLFFALVGGMFIYGTIGGFSNSSGQTWLTLFAAFVFGAIGAAVGIWMIYRAPITKVTIDRIDKTILMTRFGLFGKEQSIFDFEEIEEFCLIEDKDDEGNPVWSFGIKMVDDEIIKISSLPSHDERFKREFVYEANQFSGKQIPSTQMILELTNETGGEIG